jgi:Protein of unknown function (DUF3106)
VRVKAIVVLITSLALVGGVPRSQAQPAPQDRHPHPQPQARPPQRNAPQSPAARQQHHAGDWLRRYRGLPFNEQESALQNDPQFRKLPAERQQQLRQRLQHFDSLPPAQQQRVLNRMETWEHLTPQQKQQARDLFSRLKGLPPGRRRMVQTAVADLRQMPTAQREQVLESDRFKKMFSPEEHALLRGISKLPLAPPPGEQNEAPEQ